MIILVLAVHVLYFPPVVKLVIRGKEEVTSAKCPYASCRKVFSIVKNVALIKMVRNVKISEETLRSA